MKMSDYVVDFLVEKNVKHIFGLNGAMIVHIFDSLEKNNNIELICMNHEQAASMAADGYSRVTEDIGVCISTSGPGATNLITGVANAYYDSIPLIVITGQNPRNQLKYPIYPDLRQRGFQEMDVESLYKSISKKVIQIKNKNDIKKVLEEAFFEAKIGRPGPVVIDFPDDLQRAEINIDELESFKPKTSIKYNFKPRNRDIDISKHFIDKSKKPVIIIGSGVRLGKAKKQVLELIEKYNIPFLVTWGGKDIISNKHPLYSGTFGTIPTKYGNLVIQNSDLILALGTRLDMHNTGTDIKDFGRNAIKIIVDVDEQELFKFFNVLPKILCIKADVKEFVEKLLNKNINIKINNDWYKQIKQWIIDNPVCKNEYYNKKQYVNPYVFLKELSKYSRENDIIIPEAGANVCQTFQGYDIKNNQRLITSFNNSPMGTSIPQAIGCSFATNKGDVLAIVGDGGFNLNIQELAVVKKHNLPIKIFVFDNHGYGMMKQTQDDWLNSNYVGSTNKDGLSLPNILEISKAYGIDIETINNHKEINKIKRVLNYKKPMVCIINISPDQRIYPKLLFGRKLDEI